MQPQVSRELAAVMEPWVVSIHPLLALYWQGTGQRKWLRLGSSTGGS